MPRIWASCLRASPALRDSGRGVRGFTLLELLVVLALVALVTGLVAPAAYKGLTAARERGAVADFTALLESLPMRTYRSGSDRSYDSKALTALLPELPEGWSVAAEPHLQYAATGVAAGGVARLVSPAGPVLTLRVRAVSGEVSTSDSRP